MRLTHWPMRLGRLPICGLRADLMPALSDLVAAEGWTQTEAARRCGVTQPRMNDMLRGRISRFSLDALVNMAASCGWQVHIELVGA